MTTNKHASGYLNDRYLRLRHAVENALVPAFGLHPAPDDFEHAKDFCEAIAVAFDDMIYAVVNEARDNGCSINPADFIGVCMSALADRDFGVTLERHAYDLNENAA